MAETGITGRHVLIGMIVFFGVILVANGTFLYTAISTYTGVVSDEPYRKGLNYNERIEADQRQQALGWSEDITLAPTGDRVTVSLRDRAGNPLGGLKVEARIGRPATQAMDRTLVLQESAPGTYAASIAALDPGTWLLDVVASEMKTGGEAIVWRSRKRLEWKTR